MKGHITSNRVTNITAVINIRQTFRQWQKVIEDRLKLLKYFVRSFEGADCGISRTMKSLQWSYILIILVHISLYSSE